MLSKTSKYNLYIILGAIVLFVPYLNIVHLFDWDEINFAECAREMIVSKNYFAVTINFQAFWEKPPLFIWMQALSMNVFGINEFAARLPNAICGIVTLLVLFNIGTKVYDTRLGLLWVLVYAGSFLPHFYFKSGIIDPWFNLFIFCGIYNFMLFTNSRTTRYVIYCATLLGLAIITKGPVTMVVFALCFLIFWSTTRFTKLLKAKQILLFYLTLFLIGGLWFEILVFTGHSNIIHEFFLYQLRLFSTEDSGHGGPFYYHFLVLLVGCFPLSIMALRGFRKNNLDSPFQKHFKLWMLILFFVVLILFSIVQTKIVHYSSLCYFPLSFLAAYSIHKIINLQLAWKKITTILFIAFSFIIGISISVLPLLNYFKNQIISQHFINDEFGIECLKANVHWNWGAPAIGLILIIGVLIGSYFLSKNKFSIGLITIFISSLLTVNFSSLVISPRIEQYSQGSAIEFYQYVKNKNCYVETLGFKSYAHLFYTQKQKPENLNSLNVDWLLNGKIDKPAYFVSKINLLAEIQSTHPQLKKIYSKNGFVFWVRNSK